MSINARETGLGTGLENSTLEGPEVKEVLSAD